jgi:hypothetical protein
MALEGNIQDIMIIDPPEKAFEFMMGEARVLKYQIHNTGEMPIKDFNVVGKSILVTASGEKDTKKNYVTIKKFPSQLMPGEKKNIEVPTDYNEYIMKSGKKVVWPYRISLVVKSVKHIEEI